MWHGRHRDGDVDWRVEGVYRLWNLAPLVYFSQKLSEHAQQVAQVFLSCTRVVKDGLKFLHILIAHTVIPFSFGFKHVPYALCHCSIKCWGGYVDS